MAELNDYSPTAASNNSASPAGWPEGMAPSGLNDSDRELAARIARERDDTQGVTASGGSANAYTFAATRDTTAAYTGEMFVFRANHTNTGAATFNVTPSGGSARGAVAIQSEGLALVGGEIVSGGVYAVVYDGTQYQLANAGVVRRVAASDGADVSMTVANTAGSGSTDETASLKFEHAAGAAGGSIVSERAADYSSGANEDSTMSFRVAENGTDTERMSLSATGLTIEADATGAFDNNGQLLITGKTDTTLQLRLGYDTTNDYGEISAADNGVAWKTLALQRAGGSVTVGKSNTSSSVAGIALNPGGQVFITRSSAAPLLVNRLTTDGDVIEIAAQDTIEGTISVSGTTVTYGAFTGVHSAQWSKEPAQEPPVGTILVTTDAPYQRQMVRVPVKQRVATGLVDAKGATVWREEIVGYNTERYLGQEVDAEAAVKDAPKEQLFTVGICEKQADKRVVGVYSSRKSDTDVQSAGLGTFMVRVKGPVEAGDLIQSSATPGVGEAQPDDIVRSCTVGKATRSFAGREGVVACVLYCG